MTLVEFLLARIAEDEAAWSGGLGLLTRPDFARLSRHMLAECDAKRRIIDRHVDPDGRACNCSERGWPTDHCEVLRPLAAVYADHPDYDETWRP